MSLSALISFLLAFLRAFLSGVESEWPLSSEDELLDFGGLESGTTFTNFFVALTGADLAAASLVGGGEGCSYPSGKLL